MRVRLLLAVLALAVAALAPATAARAAGTTTVDFSAVAPGTTMADQYASVGVHFGSVSTFGLPVPAGQSHSCGGGQVEANGISGNSDQIACTADQEIGGGGANVAVEFEDPRRTVSFDFGGTIGPYPYHVYLYSESLQLLHQYTDTLPADGTVVHLSSGADATADIAYISLSIDTSDNPNGQHVWFDNLSAPLEDGRTPAYSLAIQTPTVSTYEQSTANVALSVRRFGGSTGAVPFSAGALPSGIAGVQFSPPAATGTTPAQMQVAVGGPFTGDRQVPVSVPASVGGAVGTGAVTSGVATVHVDPALDMPDGVDENRTIVPGCAGAEPSYFNARGDWTGTVEVKPSATSTPSGSAVVLPDPQFVDVTHPGQYAFSPRFDSSGDNGHGGTALITWQLSGSGITTVNATQRFDTEPVSVASASASTMPETASAIVVRGSFPLSCSIKFVDGLGQTWPIISRDYDSSTGQDVLTLGTPMSDYLPVSQPGGLAVETSDGTVLTHTPALNVASFRDTYALSESNSSDEGSGTKTYTWDEFVDTWGHDNVYDCFIICIHDPTYEKFFHDQQVDLAKMNGLCFGFATLALMFHGYGQMSPMDPRQFGADKAYDITGFADETPMKKTLVRWYESQFDGDFQASSARPYRRQTVASVKAVAHALVNANGAALVQFYRDTDGHAVDAYRVTDNPDGGFTLWLADPNLPYTSAEETNLPYRNSVMGQAQIVVKGDGTWSGSSLGWSGDMTTLQVTDAWKRGTLSLSTTDPTDAANGTITQITTGGKPTLNPDGTPLTGAPVRLFSPAAGKDAARPSYFTDRGRSYEYAVTPDAGGAGTLLTSYGDGSAAVVSSPHSRPGAADHVTITPGSPAVGFAPGGAASDVTLSLVDETGKETRRTADITGSFKKGADDAASLSGGGVSFRHGGGGGSESVSVALGSIGTGLPAGVTTSPMTIGAGQTLALTPASWSTLAGGVKYAVKDRSGRVVRSGRARLRAPRTVALSGVRAVAHGSTVVVTGKVGRRGSSPLLAASAVVGGGRAKGASLSDDAVRTGKFSLTIRLGRKVAKHAKVKVTATLLDQAASAGASVTKTLTVRAR